MRAKEFVQSLRLQMLTQRLRHGSLENAIRTACLVDNASGVEHIVGIEQPLQSTHQRQLLR